MPFALALLPFAQAAGGGGGLGQEETFGIVVLVGVGIFVVAAFALNLLFLTTLKRALDQCAPHNRRMEPGQVYLNLIPCFGAVWMFFTVSRVGQTLRDEFDERGIDVPGDYGQQLGISYAALVLAAAVSSVLLWMAALTGIPAVICWIVYWMKMAEYGRMLSEGASYREERDDYRRRRRDEQRDDDRRRRRDRDDRYDGEDEDEDERPSRRRRD